MKDKCLTWSAGLMVVPFPEREKAGEGAWCGRENQKSSLRYMKLEMRIRHAMWREVHCKKLDL